MPTTAIHVNFGHAERAACCGDPWVDRCSSAPWMINHATWLALRSKTLPGAIRRKRSGRTVSWKRSERRRDQFRGPGSSRVVALIIVALMVRVGPPVMFVVTAMPALVPAPVPASVAAELADCSPEVQKEGSAMRLLGVATACRHQYRDRAPALRDRAPAL
jgi:hypothetical protein